jgi:hypothetical protein
MEVRGRAVTPEERASIEGLFARITRSVSELLGPTLLCEEVRVECLRSRARGEGTVHVSFKLSFQVGEDCRQGCLLLPLAEAQALAGAFLMLPEEVVREHRRRSLPDEVSKEAMLELCTHVATAVEAELRARGRAVTVRSAGCQGVRAGVRPALVYVEGAELLVGRAVLRFMAFEPFRALLMVPG